MEIKFKIDDAVFLKSFCGPILGKVVGIFKGTDSYLIAITIDKKDMRVVRQRKYLYKIEKEVLEAMADDYSW